MSLSRFPINFGDSFSGSIHWALRRWRSPNAGLLKIRGCVVFHMRSFCSRETSVSCGDRSDISIEIWSSVVRCRFSLRAWPHFGRWQICEYGSWPICIAVMARATGESHSDKEQKQPNEMSCQPRTFSNSAECHLLSMKLVCNFISRLASACG
jgi:hypothetical protein